MNPIIKTNNLSINYNQSEALKNITFEMNSGDYIALAGPNGAGKTTLIKAILGLCPITKGTIELFGKTQSYFNEWNKIGYLPQKISTINTLFPATVNEVITLGLLSKKKWPKNITNHDKTQANAIMHKLGIVLLKHKLLSELSGGQQQRVLLARALVSNPKLLIFDEPSTALDPSGRDSFFNLIKELNQKDHVSVILITHDIGYMGQYSNKLLYLDKKLVFYGIYKDFCRSEKMSYYFGKRDQHMICHQHA